MPLRAKSDCVAPQVKARASNETSKPHLALANQTPAQAAGVGWMPRTKGWNFLREHWRDLRMSIDWIDAEKQRY